jgi:hypothetical protein
MTKWQNSEFGQAKDVPYYEIIIYLFLELLKQHYSFFLFA